MILCSGGVGAYMMVDSFTDHRSSKIDVFNTAALQWTSEYRSDFANITSVKVEGDDDFSTPSLNLQNSDSTPADKDSGCKEDSTKIDQYSPLKWQRDVKIYDASDDCSWHNGCATGSIASLDVYIDGSSSYIKLPLFQETSRYISDSSSNQCEDGNFYDTYTGYCYTYTVLDKICVKVSQQPGKWVIDSSNGGPGCGDSDDWQAGSYKSLKIYNSGDFPRDLTLSVTVRDSRDPLIEFYRQAGTTASSFGMCQSAKFWLGVVFLSVFVLFCIVLPVLLCRTCGCWGGTKYSRGPAVGHHNVPPSYEEHLVQPAATYPAPPASSNPAYVPNSGNQA